MRGFFAKEGEKTNIFGKLTNWELHGGNQPKWTIWQAALNWTVSRKMLIVIH